MKFSDLDAYTPVEMAIRVEQAGVNKANLDFISTFILSMLAGAFIALGAIFYITVTHDSQLGFGLTRLMGGVVFCLGLILVVIAGAELFTGNNLIVMAYIDRKITIYQLLRNWAIVFIGNFIGALVIVVMIYFSNHWLLNEGLIGVQTVMIANHKTNLGFVQAVSLGVLCNVLVCLAVWLCYSAHFVTGKILAILFPISAFVTLGFEHSVANMYFIPAGLLAMQNPEINFLLSEMSVDLSGLTFVNFLVNNLIPVTIGNIIGGGFFVALIYWFVYLRKSSM